jgi:hypothetical protein
VTPYRPSWAAAFIGSVGETTVDPAPGSAPPSYYHLEVDDDEPVSWPAVGGPT